MPAFQPAAAVAAAYDEVAADYTRLLAGALAADPIDRAQLSAFLELAAPGDAARRVADLGCGPGRVTGWLVERGAEVVGVDLSPGMVATARRALPDVRFEVGSLLDPPVAELAPFDGVLAWYSLIHVDPADHPRAMATFARLLRPGGALVLAFQIGADVEVRPERPYGHAVDLRPIRLDPDRVTRDLRAAGFALLARTDREPDVQPTVRQCYLLARASG